MHKKEEHHVIPISMRGSDHESNKEKVSNRDHTYIHKTLNINHKLLRNFRRSTNDWSVWDGERSTEYHKLREKYFQNLDELPHHLLQLHNRSFSKQNNRAKNQIHRMEDELDFEHKNFDNELIDFRSQENLTHHEFAQNVEWKLFNLMKLDKNRNDLFLRYYLKKHPDIGV